MRRSDWFSIAALALSLTACIITFLRVEIHTTNDTFVGLMAGFIGACATLIVGVQIYNSIDTKQEINNLKEIYKNKIENIENIQIQLKEELKAAKEERAQNEIILKAGISQCHGLSLHQKQPFTALSWLLASLKQITLTTDINTINSTLSDIKTHVNNIKALADSGSIHDFSHMDTINEEMFVFLENHKLYPLMKVQCEDIKKKIMSSISKIKQSIKK